MARAALDGTVVRRREGPVVPGTRVYLYKRGTTDQATVYKTDDDAGDAVLAQPLLTDANGALPGYVTSGRYDAKAVGSPDTVHVEALVAGPPFASRAGAQVSSTIATSIPPLTTTPITFDTVVADNNDFWDPAHPTRLTVKEPGLYFIQGNVEFTADPDAHGERLVLIRRNGGEAAIGGGSTDLGHGETYVPNTASVAATDTPQVHAKCSAVLEAGDYVELFALAVFGSGATPTLQSRHVPPNTPQLSIHYMGPTASVDGLPPIAIPDVTALQAALDAKAIARTTSRKSGLYYIPNGVATTGGAFTLGQMYLWPFVVDKSWAVDRVGMLVTAAAAFTQRIGLYADNADGTPGALLHDWGTIDGSSATFQTITIAKTFGPGIYWLAAVMQGSVAGSVHRCSLIDLISRFPFTGTPVAGVAEPFRRDSVSGALPDPAGTLGSDIVNASVSTPPAVVFRTA